MRLTQSEIALIKRTIGRYVDHPKIYIFGSRLDDDKRGGDIDIFVVSPNGVDFSARSAIKDTLEEALLKPIDLVIHQDFNRPIEREALRGVEI